MNGLGGLNKSPNGVVIGLVQLQLPTVVTKADLAAQTARIVALVLALFSVVTALAFHTAFADQNQLIHFLKNLAMAGGLLQVVSFGAGGLSFDARLGRA